MAADSSAAEGLTSPSLPVEGTSVGVGTFCRCAMGLLLSCAPVCGGSPNGVGNGMVLRMISFQADDHGKRLATSPMFRRLPTSAVSVCIDRPARSASSRERACHTATRQSRSTTSQKGHNTELCLSIVDKKYSLFNDIPWVYIKGNKMSRYHTSHSIMVF
jgi:hypothetical protein